MWPPQFHDLGLNSVRVKKAEGRQAGSRGTLTSLCSSLWGDMTSSMELCDFTAVVICNLDLLNQLSAFLPKATLVRVFYPSNISGTRVACYHERDHN